MARETRPIPILTMKQIRNTIVKALHEYTKVNVVPQDTTGKRPPYPYITYKITSTNNSKNYSRVDTVVPSIDPKYDNDVKVTHKTQSYFTMSISVLGENEIEAHEIAETARDWFTFQGWLFFSDINVVIINATNIGERTQLLVDDYEKRYGFDVRIRAAKATSRRVETIETNIFNVAVNDIKTEQKTHRKGEPL